MDFSKEQVKLSCQSEQTFLSEMTVTGTVGGDKVKFGRQSKIGKTK
jgi:hypothetical protein